MLCVTDTTDQPPPADVCLLLRAHAEARWLNHEVLPIVRELEQRGTHPGGDLATALAYLEALWIQAGVRFAETDAARAQLDALAPDAIQTLTGRARRYHAAVRRLRTAMRCRVERLLAPGAPTVWLEGAAGGAPDSAGR
jgi:hypothetical protein